MIIYYRFKKRIRGNIRYLTLIGGTTKTQRQAGKFTLTDWEMWGKSEGWQLEMCDEKELARLNMEMR